MFYAPRAALEGLPGDRLPSTPPRPPPAARRRDRSGRRSCCGATGVPAGTRRPRFQGQRHRARRRSATAQARLRRPVLAAARPRPGVASDLAPGGRHRRAPSPRSSACRVATDPAARDVRRQLAGLTRERSRRGGPQEYAALAAPATTCRPGGGESRRGRRPGAAAVRDARDRCPPAGRWSRSTARRRRPRRHRRAARPAGAALGARSAAWATAPGRCSSRASRRPSAAGGLRRAQRPVAARAVVGDEACRERRARWAMPPYAVHARRDRRAARGCGAAGSAPAWHAGGQGFESPQLHPSPQVRRLFTPLQVGFNIA